VGRRSKGWVDRTKAHNGGIALLLLKLQWCRRRKRRRASLPMGDFNKIDASLKTANQAVNARNELCLW
jgi:hypothetical protein